MSIYFERLVNNVANAVESYGYELVDNISRAIDDLGTTVGEKPVVNITKDINPEKIAEEVAKAMKNFVKAPQAQPAKEQREPDFSEKPDEWEEVLDFLCNKEKAQPAKDEIWKRAEERAYRDQQPPPAPPVAEKAGSKEHLLSILSSINTYLRAQGYYKEENVFAVCLADDFRAYVEYMVLVENFQPGPFRAESRAV